jgi:hypothetical protein
LYAAAPGGRVLGDEHHAIDILTDRGSGNEIGVGRTEVASSGRDPLPSMPNVEIDKLTDIKPDHAAPWTSSAPPPSNRWIGHTQPPKTQQTARHTGSTTVTPDWLTGSL